MKPFRILLVEDNNGDIFLTKEAFEDAAVPSEVEVCKDGAAAITYLTKTASETPSALPDIILLDINLPKRNGHEVLVRIKSDPSLKHIPVIMLTTSAAPAEVTQAYEEHANCYIVKPVDASKFIEVVASIVDFWFTVITLPAKPAS